MRQYNSLKFAILSATIVGLSVLYAIGHDFQVHISRIAIITVLNSICVGIIVYILVDFFLYTEQMRTYQAVFLSVINCDKSLAQKLPIDQKRAFARHWFSSAISDDIAQSALHSLVDRYVTDDKWRYRISNGLNVHLRRLDSNVEVPGYHTLCLLTADYFQVHEHSRFLLPSYDPIFERGRPMRLSIIIAMTDAQLTAAYLRKDCIFRNLMALRADHHDALLTAFNKHGRHLLACSEQLQKTYDVLGGLISVHLSIAGLDATLEKACYEPDTGIVLNFASDSSIGFTRSPEFSVNLSYLQSRRRQWFSELYDEPTRGTNFVVEYDQAFIRNVVSYGFIATSQVNPPKMSPGPGRVEIAFNNEWIFPKSGAVLFWDDPGQTLEAPPATLPGGHS